MSKKEDLSSIKNLGRGIMDTLNATENNDIIKGINPEEKKYESEVGYLKTDTELRKEVLIVLKEDIIKKIKENKAEGLKKQLIKLEYEKELCLNTNTKNEQKIVPDKLQSQLNLAMDKLTKLQSKLSMIDEFFKQL